MIHKTNLLQSYSQWHPAAHQLLSELNPSCNHKVAELKRLATLPKASYLNQQAVKIKNIAQNTRYSNKIAVINSLKGHAGCRNN